MRFECGIVFSSCSQFRVSTAQQTLLGKLINGRQFNELVRGAWACNKPFDAGGRRACGAVSGGRSGGHPLLLVTRPGKRASKQTADRRPATAGPPTQATAEFSTVLVITSYNMVILYVLIKIYITSVLHISTNGTLCHNQTHCTHETKK